MNKKEYKLIEGYARNAYINVLSCIYMKAYQHIYPRQLFKWPVLEWFDYLYMDEDQDCDIGYLYAVSKDVAPEIFDKIEKIAKNNILTNTNMSAFVDYGTWHEDFDYWDEELQLDRYLSYYVGVFEFATTLLYGEPELIQFGDENQLDHWYAEMQLSTNKIECAK